MDVLDLIFGRRSIRNYVDREVEEETLVLLLKAAMAAPTACNQQPWEMIVITDKNKLDALRQELVFGNYNAPAAIVVCGNMKLARGGFQKTWMQDCSAATQNILLASYGLGLGSVWIGLDSLPAATRGARKVLSLPDYVVPMSMVYVGYPAEEKEPRTQYNEKRVYSQEYDPDRKHRARPKNLKYS